MQYYGDLNDPGGVVACNELAVYARKPIAIAFRRQRKLILWSEYGDKKVILTGSTRTARHRFFPAVK
jgi:hypothetical protein